MPAATKRTLSSPNKTRSGKRRKTAKELTFTDDEGDAITFRLSNGVLSELVNGKISLGNVTMMSINENTGRVEDDDGAADGFNLKEIAQLSELRALASEASEVTIDWIGKKDEMIEDPVKPVQETAPATTEEIVAPVKKASAEKTTPNKKATKRASRSRSRSKTPKKAKKARTPRKPKVWDPISFEDSEGDTVTFSLTAESHLQEAVNGKVTLEKVTRLEINTAICRIIDDDGKYDAFTVKDGSELGHLRDMALHAMDLRMEWSTEAPTPEAWCSVM